MWVWPTVRDHIWFYVLCPLWFLLLIHARRRVWKQEEGNLCCWSWSCVTRHKSCADWLYSLSGTFVVQYFYFIRPFLPMREAAASRLLSPACYKHIVHKSLILSKHTYKFKFIAHCTFVFHGKKSHEKNPTMEQGQEHSGSAEVRSWDFKLNGNLWLCGLPWSQSGAVNDSIMWAKEKEAVSERQ